MHAKYKQDLELVHYRLDEMEKKIDELKHEMTMSHGKTDETLRFIKENLFNPNEGLWAETKLNSQFRENTSKWRGIAGTGLVALIIDKVWNIFTA